MRPDVDPLTAFAVAFGVIALAELGDKSQLVVLAQASRASPLRVAVEAAAAFAVLSAAAVVAGAALARFVPAWAVGLASGLLFLLFGLLAAREARQPGEDERPAKAGGTFALVLVSELGDKTQLATAALAASSGHAVATGLGAWAAESALAVVAVVVGGWLARRVTPRRRAVASAALFLVLGAATLAWTAWTTLT